MTLKVNGKTYQVEENGSDYVCRTEPNPADFEGVFDAEIDGAVEKDMMLAGIQLLEDGWHISLYHPDAQQMHDNRVDAILAALLGGEA